MMFFANKKTEVEEENLKKEVVVQEKKEETFVVSDYAMERYKKSKHYNQVDLTHEEIELLFCDKKDWDWKKDNQFYKQFEDVLKKLSKENESIYYSNIVFSKTEIFNLNDEKPLMNFENCLFYTKLNINNKKIKKLSFKNCLFYHSLDFKNLDGIYFYRCKFYKELHLNIKFYLNYVECDFLQEDKDKIILNAKNIKLEAVRVVADIKILEKCQELEVSKSEFNRFYFESNIDIQCNKIYIFNSSFKESFYLDNINSNELSIIKSKFKSNSEYAMFMHISGKQVLDFRIHEVECNNTINCNLDIEECSLNTIEAKEIYFNSYKKIKKLKYSYNNVSKNVSFCPITTGDIERSSIGGKLSYYGQTNSAKLYIKDSTINECYISDIFKLDLDNLESEDIKSYAILNYETKIVFSDSKIHNTCKLNNYSELKIYDSKFKNIISYDSLEVLMIDSIVEKSASLGEIKKISINQSTLNSLSVYFLEDAYVKLFSNQIDNDFICIGSQLKRLEILRTKVKGKIFLKYINITDICILDESSCIELVDMRLTAINKLAIYKSNFKKLDFDCSFIEQARFTQLKGLNEENETEELSDKHFASKESLKIFEKVTKE